MSCSSIKKLSETDSPLSDSLTGDAHRGGGSVLLAPGVSTTFGLVRVDTTQSINIVNVQTAVGMLH